MKNYGFLDDHKWNILSSKMLTIFYTDGILVRAISKLGVFKNMKFKFVS